MTLQNELVALIARHECTGREFVACALRVAEGYFEADDLPALADVGELAEAISTALQDGAR